MIQFWGACFSDGSFNQHPVHHESLARWGGRRDQGHGHDAKHEVDGRTDPVWRDAYEPDKTSTERKRSLEFLGSAFFQGFMKKVSHNPENLELYTFRHNQRPKPRRYDWTSIHISLRKTNFRGSFDTDPHLRYDWRNFGCLGYYPRLRSVRILVVQVIQFVTFLSPNVGGHQQPLSSGSRFHIPKKVTSRIARFGRCLWNSFAQLHEL